MVGVALDCGLRRGMRWRHVLPRTRLVVSLDESFAGLLDELQCAVHGLRGGGRALLLGFALAPLALGAGLVREGMNLLQPPERT